MTLSLRKVVLCLAAAAILTLGCTTDGGQADLPIRAAGVSGPIRTVGVSEEVAARAVNVALSDTRFRGGNFLSDLASAEVRQDQRGLIVDVQLGSPSTKAWPPDSVCSAPGAGGPIFGVRWLLNAEGREILAVSPIWADDVSCL